MVGNVYLTGARRVGRRRMSHEVRHATQWAAFGWGFVPLYGLAEVAGRRGGCGNVFERDAGLANGGYRC